MLQQTSHTRHVVDIKVAVARPVIMVAPVILGSPVGGRAAWTVERHHVMNIPADLLPVCRFVQRSGRIAPGALHCHKGGEPAVMRSPVAMRRGDDVQVQSPVQQLWSSSPNH